MENEYPLKEIDQNQDKTAEHWFEHYSVEIQKHGYSNIPLLNKDDAKKHQMVRFQGLISNQMNTEYFDKMCQFRELDDIKQADPEQFACKKDITQRFPMLLRTETNQTKWRKSVLFNNDSIAPQVDAVIAKFYCHTETLKIHDSVEIYGVWSPKVADSKVAVADKENTMDANEAIHETSDTNETPDTNKEKKVEIKQDLYKVPTNAYDKLPVIHVLYWKKIEWENPLISTSPKHLNDDVDKLFEFYYENLSLIRSSLIQYIARNYTSNDHLLAEYIVLNLISKVVSNKNGIIIGHFPLNIRGSLDSYKIKQLYETFAPFVLNINLSLKYLNDKRLDPVKNNETDELNAGVLQLRHNTAVVIDESKLEPGQLNKVGLQNLESLKTLITEQKVNYDFVFHTIPFSINASVLVLSKTKPLPQLQTVCHIYAENEMIKENNDQEENEEETFTLDQYRIYLSLCKHLMDKFALNSKEVCSAIEEDFVELRKKDKGTNEDTLHHRLLMMRLINASFLNQTDDDDMMNILKYMQMLESKRKARNEKFIQAAENTKGTPLNTVTEDNEEAEEADEAMHDID